MKYLIAPLAFGLAASAAVIPRDQCCFQLTASGSQSGTSGTVGQLDDGQNRIGGGYPAATYCIDNGAITDSSGRGCILTPPTTQFQCDQGATAQSGFAIGSNGEVTYNGGSTFYACATGDNGSYNIYTESVSGQSQCFEISLTSSGCGSGAQSTSAPASSAPAAATSVVTEAGTSAAATSAATSAAPETETLYATTVVTITSCGPEVTECPASSTVVQTTSVPISSGTPQSSAPASVPATSAAPSSSEEASSVPATSAAPSSSEEASSSPAPATSETPSPSPTPASTTEAESSAASSTAVETSSAPAASSSGCAANLNGEYQYPHLIVPVDSSSPDTAEGTSYNGTVTSTVSTIFNFDIPQSYEGHTCSLVFLLPEQSQLETSSFTLSGSGAIDFSMLSGTASQSTTYSNAPSVETDYGVTTVQPGNSYTIASFACPAGQTVSYELKTSDSTSLNYFQDYNPSPIGLYVVEC